MTTNQSKLLFQIYYCLTFGYLVFIGIASFYLTKDVPNIDAVFNRFMSMDSNSTRFNLHNLRDIATNILLYMPLGVLVCMLRSIKRPIRFFNIGLLVGFIVSIFVEVTQAFIGRYSDPTDVMSNGVGFIAGYQIMWLLIYKMHLNIAHLIGFSLDDESEHVTTLSALRFGYILIAYFVSLLPLNITVSFTDIMNKLSAYNTAGLPRLILDPFYHFRGLHDAFHTVFLAMLMVIPVAMFTAMIRLRQGKALRASTALACFVFVFAIEFSQIFIINGSSDIFLILVAPCLGFLTASVVRASQSKSKVQAKDRANPKFTSHAESWILAVFAYACFIAMLTWSPYNFEVDPGVVKQKLLSDANLIPFKSHFTNRSVNAAIDIVREVLIYLPFGALSARVFLQSPKRIGNGIIFLGCTLLGGSYALVMELTQLLIVGRHVDITDPILGALGCFGGAVLYPLFTSPVGKRC